MRLSKRLFAAIAAGVVVISTGLGGVAQASIVEKPTLPKTSAVKGYPPTPELNAKPKKAGEVTTLAACAPPCYHYAAKTYSNTGITATKTTQRIIKPYLDLVATGSNVNDYHTLGETSIQGGSGGGAGTTNIIEVGQTIDPALNGGSQDPHIFVFAWYTDSNGVRQECGYNGQGANICGYIDKASNTLDAGDSINADLGTEQSFEIYHYAPSSAWIINYKGVEVGRYPDSLLHSSNYTSANLVQNFGEVALRHFPSCTDMGNGKLPTTSIYYPTHGAEFRAFNTALGGSYSPATYTGTVITSPTNWDLLTLSSNDAFYYGGPGAGNLPPTNCA